MGLTKISLLNMKCCESCGMPLIKIEDFANGDEDSHFCGYCVDDNGKVKSAEEIFASGVEFFMSQFGDDKEKAEKLTRKNMKRQPYWKNRNDEVLNGEMVTDEEFREMLEKCASL